MLRDKEPIFFSSRYLAKLEKMRKNAKRPLYTCCKVSKLVAVLKLLELKFIHGLFYKALETCYVHWRNWYQALMSYQRQHMRPSRWSARSVSKLKKSMHVPMFAYCTVDMNTKIWMHDQSVKLRCTSMLWQTMTIGPKEASYTLHGVLLYFLVCRGCLWTQSQPS